MIDFIVELVVEVFFRAVIYVAFDFVSRAIFQRLGLGGRLSGCLTILVFAVFVGLCLMAIGAVASSPGSATTIPR